MGAPQEVIQEIFTVIEGGNTIGEAAQIIQFPSDNGSTVYNAVNMSFKSTNGTGLNYWVAAVAQGAAAISAGAILVTVALPEFMALAVPCLGIAVGTAWYNIDPDGWTHLAELLLDEGYTIKNKVVAFMVENGTLGFIPGEIEILKDELCRLGAFDHGAQYPEYEPAPVGGIAVETNIPPRDMMNYALSKIPGNKILTPEAKAQLEYITEAYSDYTSIIEVPTGTIPSVQSYFTIMQLNPPQDIVSTSRPEFGFLITVGAMTIGEIVSISGFTIDGPHSYLGDFLEYFVGEFTNQYGRVCASSVNGTVINNENLQDFATYPSIEDLISTTYPAWIPWEFPSIPGWSIPEVYPVQYPDLLPSIEPYQDPAQNPQADPDEEAEHGLNNLEDPQYDPITDPAEDPQIVDPDPPIENPDPIGGVDPKPTPDPIDPDPPIPPSPVIPTPPMPPTVSGNKLFTVYNPSAANLDALGGYLWDDSLMEILKKIWQDPLDGIIGLSQVYCTPVTGSSHNIILGYLDSGVSAPVVTDQFKTIDCGTITIPELNNNATDYTPYTGMQLYLPFIGITEIDVNEFMSGSISVVYHVDVYTGTCLAEVKMIRTKDVPNGGIVYTFNGNCSQQLPLTSGDQKGLLSALIGAAGVGIGIATGGALGVAAIAGSVQGALSKEMLHVSHSGNLSANAGIMGQKKPYVIISRQTPYNANSYNRLYGYPSNKTVMLGNCSGFVRVKACHIESIATSEERSEIEQLLKSGVIM